MANHKFAIWVPLICCVGLISFSTLHTQSRNMPAPHQDKKPVPAEAIDTSTFPIAEYEDTGPTDPKKRAKRDAKGKKYNSPHAPRIAESLDSIYATIGWDVGLPALPVTQSAAVVVGRITKADAYLSENKTSIYSEFEVQIDEVLKTDDSSIVPGSSLLVQRAGGRVRFPSGKIAAFVVSHQQLPTVGTRYLLFLTHDNHFGELLVEDYAILAGYEFRSGRVFPLDKPLPKHRIMTYKGVDESVPLNDLKSALTSPLPTE